MADGSDRVGARRDTLWPRGRRNRLRGPDPQSNDPRSAQPLSPPGGHIYGTEDGASPTFPGVIRGALSMPPEPRLSQLPWELGITDLWQRLLWSLTPQGFQHGGRLRTTEATEKGRYPSRGAL